MKRHNALGYNYSRHALEFSKQVIDKLRRRDIIRQDDLVRVEKLQALLLAAVPLAELNDPAEIFLRNRNCRLDKATNTNQELVS